MTEAEATAEPDSKGQVGRALSEGRRLAGIAYRDPEHVSERITLNGAQKLGEESVDWAMRARRERPDVPRGVIAEETRIQTARVARLDGAVAGTPFLIALVPGYLAYLWQEGVMERRIAALYDRDAGDLQTSAEILVLRRVHPTVEAAHVALRKVIADPSPEKPTERRRLRVWVRSIYRLLVFGGFITPSEDDERNKDKYAHWRLRAAIGALIGAAIWVTTWVLPVTFMIAMAWGCETHARTLGSRSLLFYGGQGACDEAAAGGPDRGQSRTKRDLIRGFFLVLSIAIPVVFIAYADHVRNSTGINWIGALGALVAASLVIAISVLARQR